MGRQTSTIRPLVSISSTQRRLRVPVAKIRQLVDHVARAEGRAIERVDVAVVGRKRMATLHRLYLNRTGSTDVLSFDLSSPQSQ